MGGELEDCMCWRSVRVTRTYAALDCRRCQRCSVRAVKEVALRPTVERRVGSIPTCNTTSLFVGGG